MQDDTSHCLVRFSNFVKGCPEFGTGQEMLPMLMNYIIPVVYVTKAEKHQEMNWLGGIKVQRISELCLSITILVAEAVVDACVAVS